MSESPQTGDTEQGTEERPPLGSWNRMYALVLGVLVVLTILFAIFTKVFE